MHDAHVGVAYGDPQVLVPASEAMRATAASGALVCRGPSNPTIWRHPAAPIMIGAHPATIRAIAVLRRSIRVQLIPSRAKVKPQGSMCSRTKHEDWLRRIPFEVGHETFTTPPPVRASLLLQLLVSSS
jgi:hypothetical protein